MCGDVQFESVADRYMHWTWQAEWTSSLRRYVAWQVIVFHQ